eukprot:11512-Heterococcus_DN1.PRE.1
MRGEHQQVCCDYTAALVPAAHRMLPARMCMHSVTIERYECLTSVSRALNSAMCTLEHSVPQQCSMGRFTQ